jgi:hypothetical protein
MGARALLDIKNSYGLAISLAYIPLGRRGVFLLVQIISTCLPGAKRKGSGSAP